MPGVVSKLRRKDLHAASDLLPAVIGEVAADGLQEHLTCLGDPSSDDARLQVQDVQERAERLRDPHPRLFQRVTRGGVALAAPAPPRRAP